MVEGSRRVTIQPSDDTQPPLHGMKRPAGGVGRGFKHPEARVVRAEEAFVWFSSARCEAPTAVGLCYTCGLAVAQRYYVCPGRWVEVWVGLVGGGGGWHAAAPHPPPLPLSA